MSETTIQDRRAGEFDLTQVTVDFKELARQIVRQVQRCVMKQLDEELGPSCQKLTAEEIERTVETLESAFQSKQIGLQGLVRMARKEIVLVALKRAIPKYTNRNVLGKLEPMEYFERFYLPYFVKFDIPASAISIVDANLHMQINKRVQFRDVADLLSKSRSAQETTPTSHPARRTEGQPPNPA